MSFRRRRGTVVTVAGIGATLSLLGVATLARPLPAQQPAEAQKARIGQVSMIYSHMELKNAGAGAYRFALSGNGTRIWSAQYSIAASSIVANFKANVLETGEAAGGVTVEVRDAAAAAAGGAAGVGQTTVVTCDRATFTRLRDDKEKPTGRNRIVMRGHVRTKTFDPAFAEPLINESESTTVEFGGKDGMTTTFERGRASVTPKEPAASPAPKPGAPKKP